MNINSNLVDITVNNNCKDMNCEYIPRNLETIAILKKISVVSGIATLIPNQNFEPLILYICLIELKHPLVQ